MRVQSCRSLSRFLIKTESFLLENEVVNNLICEVLLEVEKKSKSIQWAGNILENGKILLCAVLTSSNYLLISSASISSTHHLIRFIKRNLLNFVKETPLSIRITNYKFYHIYILIRCTEYE